MSLKNIHFILVRPQLGENIGSVARAVKNFNISKLRLIKPRCEWPNEKAIATSVGANDILKSTKIYDSLKKSMTFGKKEKEIITEVSELEREYKDEVSSLTNSVSND